MRRIESTKSLETVPPQETVQLRLTCHDEETANAKSVARWGKKMDCRSFGDVFAGDAATIASAERARLLCPAIFVECIMLMLPRYH